MSLIGGGGGGVCINLVVVLCDTFQVSGRVVALSLTLGVHQPGRAL
jgi:hypothetical protein